MMIETEFMPRDRVYIDGCSDLVGIVTAVYWRHVDIVNYEVSWVSNGKSESNVIEGWRLTHAPSQ